MTSIAEAVLCLSILYLPTPIEAWPSHHDSDCKIAILEASQTQGLGAHCDAELRLHSVNGVIHVNSNVPGGESHIYDQQAAPYWLGRAIRESKYYTTDVIKANVVYVDDYCLMMAATASMHSGGFKDGYDPNATLHLAYHTMMKSARYRRSNGSDYVFFSPHPLTGMAGFRELACNAFGRALHLVAEATQRYLCPHIQARSNFLVVPYASDHVRSLSQGKLIDMDQLRALFAFLAYASLISPCSCKYVEDDEPWPERDIFIFFHGSCASDEKTGKYGMRMRWHVVRRIQETGLEAASVTCRGDRLDMPHGHLRSELKRSVWCVLVPGDTISSRRLTEIMLSGCIPVFVGPPWHAVPLSSEISYPSFSIIFQLESLRTLGDNETLLLEPERDAVPDNVFDQHWWITPANVRAAARKIQSVEEMLQILQNTPDFEIKYLQEKGAAVRSYFQYRHGNYAKDLYGPGTATSAIIHHMCRRAHQRNPTILS